MMMSACSAPSPRSNPSIEIIVKDITSRGNKNQSRLEAHVGFFRLLMKGIFSPYVL